MPNALFLGVIAFSLTAPPGRASNGTLSSLATAQNTVAGQSLAAAQDSAAHPDSANAQAIQSELKQSGAGQEEVRARTTAVIAQVQSLIDELAANGITGDDAKVLLATKAALTHLSGPEMDRVIASLQQAGAATNPADTATHAVRAYATQKGIVLQFRMILKDYELRQAASVLQARFKELTDRQTATMRTTADVARKVAGLNQGELSTTDQTTQQIVQTDQNSIVDETGLAGSQLEKAATDGADGSLQKARDDMKSGQVEQLLGQANDDLKAGHFFKAFTEETAARDELRRITKDLDPPVDDATAIAQTAADLAKLIAEQKALLGQTDGGIKAQTLTTGLDDQQGNLVDEARQVQQDILTTNVAAAGLVQEAIDPPMQTSRAQLRALEGFPLAETAQQAAIAKLEAAEKLLQQELADAEAKPNDETPKDNESTPDLTALTAASTKLDDAVTDVGLAMNDSNPQAGATPPSPSPDTNSPAGTPPDGTPPSTNSLAGNPPDGMPPTGTPPDGTPPSGTPSTSPTMSQAMTDLKSAEANVNAVANTPGLPDETIKAVTDAKTEIEKGKGTATNGDAPGTMAHAGAAMTALTRAQATLSLAMSGMPGGQGMPGPNGPPMPTPPSLDVPSPNGAQSVTGGSKDKPSEHYVADTAGKNIELQRLVRGALVQTATEKRPQEYAPQIDQYLKNLADESTGQ